jgi:phosphoglycerate kinase
MKTFQFSKRTVADEPIAGRTVLVRVDYNVPLADGKITNDFRIKASLPTLQYLLKREAKRVVLISHLGRPKGVDESLSLRPTAERLAELLTEPVEFVPYVPGLLGDEPIDATARVVMLENLRFSPEEEADSTEFAEKLVGASGADLFVQDGFAVVHRAHASTDAITKLLPSVAGFLLEKEVSSIEGAISEPERPLLAIIGGAKSDDKIPLVNKMLDVADRVCLGGLLAQEYEGEPDDKVTMPVDGREDETGVRYDIGDRSALQIVQAIDDAATVIWNGTLGKAEVPEFARSSELVATALGRGDKTTIICGGDTTGFVMNYQALHPELQYTLISTGGGASLELILGQPLPGLSNLLDK